MGGRSTSGADDEIAVVPQAKLKPGQQEVDPKRLQEWDRNPRSISDKRLATLVESMRAEPDMLQARPLIALPDGTVIAGNMRLRAARELNWTQVPAFVIDLDTDRAAEWALRDNNAFGDWVPDELGTLLAELDDGVRDLTLMGFKQAEIARLIKQTGDQTIDTGKVGRKPARPRTKTGDVWMMGEHRLICGSTTDREVVGNLMGDDRAVLVLGDPPFNVNYTGGEGHAPRQDSYEDSWSPSDYQQFLTDVLASGEAFARDDAALHFWFNPQFIRQTLAGLDAAGWDDRSLIVWVKNLKTGALNTQYKPRHEVAFYGHKRGKAPRWLGATNEWSIWEVDRLRDNEHHPAQKPLELYEIPLRNHTRRGDIVLELFGGSGSSLIASEQMGRCWRGVELSPGYCDVIVKRWESESGNKATVEGR